MTSGGVVGQHDPARPDADGRGAAGDVPDDDGGGGAGDAGQVVMLGHPEACVAPALGVPGQVEAVAEGLGRAAALPDRRQVEDGVRASRIAVS